jgi:hypothetical protein
MNDEIMWSKACDFDVWDDGLNERRFVPVYSRPVEFLAGPYKTLEEAQAALRLLVMPTQGSA